MTDICGDNRFEVIAEAKKDLLESTNIEMSPDEMSVIDNFLFRCWQMGWLRQYETFEFCNGENPCKEYDQEKHCCHRWTKVIRQTVEDVKNNQWIPVTEALPEEEKDVLVSVHFDGHKGSTVNIPPIDYVEIASHIEGVWSSLSDEYKAVECNHHVVAWAKLPEPWRGE